MKKIAVLILLLSLGTAFASPAKTENRKIGENQSEAKRAAKQQRKISNKAAKRQRKALKRTQRAQRKAARAHQHG